MQKYSIDKDIVLDAFEVVGEHTNSKHNTIIEVRCKICNKVLNISPMEYKLGYYRCNHGKRLIAKDCIGETFGNISITGIYGKDERNRTFITCKCVKCNKESIQYFHRITSYKYKCSCEKIDYGHEMLNKFSKLIGKGIGTDTVLDARYIPENDFNHRTLVKLKCNLCGAEREVGANTFVNSKNYKKCNCMPKTRDIKNPLNKYNQTVLNKRFGSIVVEQLSEGTSLQTIYATCKCDCGKMFTTALSNIVSGDTKSCGCRTESYGEKVITDVLNNCNLKFEKQKTYNDLISICGRKLYIDFVVFKDNKEIAFIEYDGPHHNIPFAYGHYTDDSELISRYNNIVANDNIKDMYAEKLGVQMIRIPYKNNINHKYIKEALMGYFT